MQSTAQLDAELFKMRSTRDLFHERTPFILLFHGGGPWDYSLWPVLIFEAAPRQKAQSNGASGGTGSAIIPILEGRVPLGELFFSALALA